MPKEGSYTRGTGLQPLLPFSSREATFVGPWRDFLTEREKRGGQDGLTMGAGYSIHKGKSMNLAFWAKGNSFHF